MAKYKLPKIEELLDSGAHIGHQTKRWHPKMEPYIYTVRKNTHIIDLEKTEESLKNACDFLYEVAKSGNQIVFVGTKKQAREIVENEGKRSGALYVTERWIGGTLTNFKVIKRNIDKLLTFVKRKEEGDLEKYTKKERLLIDREIEKLQRNIGGISSMKGTPGAMFIVDGRREKTAIREADRAGVPVVALLDTNSDPTGIDYVIPGNDDAIKSIAVILKALSSAIEEGYKEYGKAQTASKEPTAEVVVEEVKPAVNVSIDKAPRVSEETVLTPEEIEKTEKELTKESKEEEISKE